MQILAYTNNSDTNISNKVESLVYINTYTVDPYNAVDIERPSFIMDYNSSLVNCNYIRVPDFGRYYFVTGKVNKGGQIILECLSDPLTSFINNIKSCDITVLRSSSVGAPTMYEDNKLPVYPNKNNITSIVMESDNEDLNRNVIPPADCYVLTVIAGTPT